MDIKLIIFDLDGVLLDVKTVHYDALNQAILKIVGERYAISMEEHHSIYDGLKTNEKLDLLSKTKGLPRERHKDIWNEKQKITFDYFSNIEINSRMVNMMSTLKKDGYFLACCSNSIRRSVYMMLSRIGVIEYFDLVLSNEDVKSSKPHPEIYWKCMSMLETLPENTLIIEDSPNGLLSANRSGANILRVNNSTDLTITKIKNKIMTNNNKNMKKWQADNLNVLIPMAGAGSRFEKAGYTFPKPLIDVFGKPMIDVVVNNLNVDANYIYIVQKTHREKYNLDILLNLITPNCRIVEIDKMTEGAACTTLLAKEYINNDHPLLIANSDQFIEWNNDEFFYKMNENNVDAGMLTFNSNHPKWSFAKIDSFGYVTEVAEKRPISDIATVGVYYWKNGSDYVKYAEQMIEKNIRVNDEFYICPVFNEAIADNKKIKIFNVHKMWGLGTPEDLDYFIKNNQ